MKICWFGTYNKTHPRNYIFFDGLAKLDVEVVHCRVDNREAFRYFKLAKKFLSLKKDFDAVYVGFPAQPAVLVAKLLTRKHVVMDAMVSVFENAVIIRKEKTFFHPKVIKLLLIDWLSAVLADQIVADTEELKDYWASWLFVKPNKVDTVHIGSSTKYFFPLNLKSKVKQTNNILVQYHGSYIKVQGLDVIIEAIKLLKDDDDIQFRFIGGGQEYKEVRDTIERCCKDKVVFIERIPFTEMNVYLNEADVIFGLFGDAKKADRAIPNKLYEGVAVKRTVINKDTPAVRREFNSEDIMLVKRDPRPIADAIIKLKNSNLREKYAEAGHKAFLKKFTEEKIAAQLVKVLAKHIN